MRALAHRGISMSGFDPLAVKAVLVSVTVVSLAVSNGVAWIADINVGAVVSSATIISLALIGLASQAIRQIGLARAQAWAARMRIEEQVRQETERAYEGSFAGQIKRLQDSVEEGNRRVEDANLKLHQIRGQANLDRLIHQEEAERLTEQLRIATEQLRATAAELHATREENRALLARVSDMQRQVDINARNIGQIAVLSGELPAVRPPDPDSIGEHK